ncbi:MAG: hypothetical protein WC619_01895 [Patescibacteria group bacterium]
MSDKSYTEVFDLGGNIIRTYTEKDNGKNHAALAKEFATKNGYVVKGNKDTEANAKKEAARKEIEEAAASIKEGKEFTFGGKTYSPDKVAKLSEKDKKALTAKIEKKKEELDEAIKEEADKA